MSGNYLANPLEFLITTLFSLYILAVMLRFILGTVGADFYNPVSQFLVRITNPLLVPLRKVIPSVGKFDTSAILLMLFLQVVSLGLVVLIRGIDVPVMTLLIIAIGELVMQFDGMQEESLRERIADLRRNVDGQFSAPTAAQMELLGELREEPTLEIILHAGTLGSILVVYWRRILRLLASDRRVIPLLVVGTIPAVIVGLTIKTQFEQVLRSPWLASALLLVTGAMLIVPKSATRERR